MDNPRPKTTNSGELSDVKPGVAAPDPVVSEADGPSDRRSKHLSTGRLVWYAAAIAFVGALALGALFASSVGDQEAVSSAQGVGFDRFEDLAFETTDGGSSHLGDYGGQPLVVNFFASWCAPCRAEIPHFESANELNGDRVKFLGVNHDIDDSSWKAFVAETEITFETVFQPGTEIWSELDAKGMPTTAFISADGEVLQVYTGILDQTTLQSLIDEHLLENA